LKPGAGHLRRQTSQINDAIRTIEQPVAALANTAIIYRNRVSVGRLALLVRERALTVVSSRRGTPAVAQLSYSAHTKTVSKARQHAMHKRRLRFLMHMVFH
jgi:hypothetical protein